MPASAAPQKIVIIEKNLAYRDYLRTLVSEEGMVSFCFEDETTCMDNLDVLDPDLLVVGSLGANSIYRLLNALQIIEAHLPVLLVNTDSSISDYVQTNRYGVIWTVNKHEPLPKLGSFVQAAQEEYKSNKTQNKMPVIIGNTQELVRIKKALPDLSRSEESVLIKGEKGVGKETIARWIHFNSPARDGLFIKIDAGALLKEAIEWRLLEFFKTHAFNTQKDAGSDARRLAGTLYFDEVFDLSNALQSELLLILEDGKLKTDYSSLEALPAYRIIAGTTQSSEQPVIQGRFRKDLYYRLNVLNLAVPPLRARRQDIALLTDFFIYKYCRECSKSYFRLSREVMNIFNSYDWPRNVDELEAAVRRSVIVHNEKKILAGFYGKKKKYERMQNTARICGSWIDTMLDPTDYLSKIDTMSLKDICWDCLASVEKNVMKKALDQTNWNRRKAADMLAISYKSMLNKIKEYGLA